MRWGKTWEESQKDWLDPHGGEWFDWFAWHPVRLEKDLTWVWWEWVQKKYPWGYTYWLPEYRIKPHG